METEQLLHLILGITEEFKALDPKVLRVTEVCSFADYFVFVSGTSSRHIKSIAEELILKCKHIDEAPLNVEGLDAGEWCLLDFGSVIVHVFDQDKRTHYNLEDLWSEAEEVRMSQEKSEA